MPLTLLGIDKETEMVVLELGDNHIGEIQELCQISKPDFGLITNIGKDHLEGFGSMEANIRAKSELFDYILRFGRTNIFVNSHDSILKNMSKRFAKPIMYGAESDPHFAQLETEKRKVLVLGDMFELGEISQSENQNMIAFAQKQGFSKLVFCGHLYHEQKNEEDLFFPKREELERYLLKFPFENTCFLLKGSRGMALEKLVEVV